MLVTLRHKFEQHEYLRKELLSTEDAELIEVALFLCTREVDIYMHSGFR